MEMRGDQRKAAILRITNQIENDKKRLTELLNKSIPEF